MGKRVHEIKVRVGAGDVCHAVSEYDRAEGVAGVDEVWSECGYDRESPFRDIVIRLTVDEPTRTDVVDVAAPAEPPSDVAARIA